MSNNPTASNPKHADTNIGHALISGFTLARANPVMKGNLIIKKTQYFCFLGQHTLYYATGETDETPKGEFSLRVYDNVEIENEAKFQFKLFESNGKNSVVLTSLMKETMNSWIKAIQKVLNYLKGGNNIFEFQSETTHEYNMYIKVWAGKSFRNSHDTFVSMMANGEEKTRTSIEWQSTDPNFNQEFDIVLEGSTPHVVFGVFDIRTKLNFHIGSVALPVDWNQKPFDRSLKLTEEEVRKGIEQGIPQQGPNWYDLQVTSQRELSLYVELSKGSAGKVSCQVKQLTGQLSSANKELYRVLGLIAEPPKGKSKLPTYTEIYRTPDSKDGNYKNLPKFEYDAGKELRLEIVEISQDYEDCIGTVEISPQECNDLLAKQEIATEKLAIRSINPGYLRVEMSPTVLCILPDTQYDDLFGLIVDDDFNFAKMLLKCTSNQRVTAMSHSLVRACEKKRTAVGFVKSLLREEIRSLKTYDVAFRGNTLATKSMEYYMKLIALPQLHKVLKPLIAEVLKSKKSCEIDPVRLENMNEKQIKQVLSKNIPTLEKFCVMAFTSIQELLELLPVSLRVILSDMKKGFHEQFNGEDKAVHAGVTAFLFLRFIVPAISQPTVFQITANHPSKDAARTLMLTAITLQKLSNLKEFGDGKEPHMIVLNDFIKKNMSKMQQYIEEMATVPSKKIDSIPVDHSTLLYGREMALVAKYIDEAMVALEKEYGTDNPVLNKLLPILSAIKESEKSQADKI